MVNELVMVHDLVMVVLMSLLVCHLFCPCHIAADPTLLLWPFAVEWTPRAVDGNQRSGRRHLRSLFDTCLTLLAEYVDCIDTLQGIPDPIRVRNGSMTCLRPHPA